ncbi:MAG: AAA family ATPase [Bacteroidota bacterium]
MRIVLTGPESTGKTSLAQYLSEYYGGIYIPEFARSYIGQLQRAYTFEDVNHISRIQEMQVKETLAMNEKIFFIDTYLIISKIWFEVVFHCCPVWIDKAIRKSKIDLFLLCNTDIPWYPDAVRENGGEKREQLFSMYREELDRYGFNYEIIKGENNERREAAVEAVYKNLKIK